MKTRSLLILVVGAALTTTQVPAQTLTDFEGYAAGTQVMFRQPTFSGTTGGKLDASPNFSYVTNGFPAGNASAGLNTYYTSFSFNATNPAPLWVRFTTSGTANLPNPTVNFAGGVKFDMYSDRPLYVMLLLRETSSTQPIGGNGGSTGTIEYVGGSTDNTLSPPKGRLVGANAWKTLQFNIPSEPIKGFTGDGILTSTTGYGVLEALGLLADSGNTGTYNIWFDNFQVVAVPEPSAMSIGILAMLGLATGWLRRARK